MERSLYESELYEGLDGCRQPSVTDEYCKCTFVKCDLTLAKLKGSGIRDVVFRGCKLLCVDFSLCNTFRFAASFTGCILDYSIFHKLKLPRTIFRDCSLRWAEFGEADLASAVFDRCTLESAGFAFANLEKADMRTASGYTVDPERTRIRRVRFAYPALLGLLSKYDILTDPTE